MEIEELLVNKCHHVNTDQLAKVFHGWRKACHESGPVEELTLEESIDEALDHVLTLTNFFTAQSVIGSTVFYQ